MSVSIDLLQSMCLQTPGALPTIRWGDPGIAKTAKTSLVVNALELGEMVTVIASVHEPTDLGGGLPVPYPDGVRYESPQWFKRLCKAGKGVVFYDEYSNATPAQQAGALRTLLERTIGEDQAPEGVKFVLAANHPDTAAQGWMPTLPTTNRLIHLEDPGPDWMEWTSWLVSGPKMDGPEFRRLDLEVFEYELGQSKALAAGFIKRFPSLLKENPKDALGRWPLTYATHRSWECAVRLMATCRAMGEPEALMPLMAGTIGAGIGTSFLGWCREFDLPDPEELLRDPKSWKPDTQRTDRVFAVLNSVAAAATRKGPGIDKKEYLKRWKAGWRVMDRGLMAGEDLVAIGGRLMADTENRPEGGLLDSEVQTVLLKIFPVLHATGLVKEPR